MVEESTDAVEKKLAEPSPESPTRRETWIRLLFLLLFIFIYGVAEVVLGVIVIVQFGFKLITHETNQKLLDFTAGLNKYIYEILQFMTFNSNEKPFPFSDWPG
ncbi:MAG: DUF4389 domain-containing protein [Gammaproteobacteria bacterium]|nr:DUF4389 domain-containing protein [Gammaproteobacteria bacterium]MDH3464672.1 DUF4389 domain-containing protein [Gammaproteobacteria bacterium]